MDARKEQVRELLRSARARIDPAEVGLLQRGRRQAPGLRREDVAVLAGTSVKWYTWLEQGRDLNFSEDLVGRVADALRLRPIERDYLLRLIRKGATPCPPGDCVGETLKRTIQLAPVPAFVMTRRWDILAWNPLTARIFRDYGAIPEGERNLLRIVLTDEKYKADPESYEALARKLLGEFRVDYARRARDPSFAELVAELRQAVPCFDRLWKNVEIRNSQRASIVSHDEFGELSFERISYVPEDSTFLRVLLFIPRDPATAATVASLFTPLGIIKRGASDGDAESERAVRHPNRH